MNILLINPSYRGGTISYFPLGIAYVSTYLKQNGYNVVILDENIKGANRNILQQIEDHHIDIVGITGFITQVTQVKNIADSIKTRYPHTPVVLGGPQTQGTPEFLLNNTRADYIITGTGEMPFLAMLKSLEAGKSPENTPGLSFRRQDGSISVNPPESLNQNQFLVEKPAYELFQIEKYLNTNYHGAIGKKSLDIIWCRGCSYSCTFCINSMQHNKIYFRPVADLIGEIRYLKENFGVNDFIFADENFTINRKKSVEMLTELKKENITWVTSVRVDLLDQDILTLMKESGCRKIMVGFESFSPRVLENMNKKMNLKDIPEKINLIRDLGIQLEANFMVGMPEETPETITETERFCVENGLFWGPAYTTPFPGTQLYEDCRNIIGDEEQYILKLGDLDFSKTMLVNLTRFPKKTIIKTRNHALVNTLAGIIKRKFRFSPLQLARFICRAMLFVADLQLPPFLLGLLNFIKIRLIKKFLIPLTGNRERKVR
ncbi:MAG: B12-binding domain-containing radical SAM protein [Dehalococcoidales bacterium]|nr:B12-binding domain-containing radical SAM protein [Dehalococcoidales bacterium]